MFATARKTPMKPFLISVALFTSLLCLSGCSTSTPVMAATGGVYTVTKTGTTSFTPVGNLRTQAYREANEFAAKKGMVAEVVSVNETAAGFAKFGGCAGWKPAPPTAARCPRVRLFLRLSGFGVPWCFGTYAGKDRTHFEPDPAGAGGDCGNSDCNSDGSGSD